MLDEKRMQETANGAADFEDQHGAMTTIGGLPPAAGPDATYAALGVLLVVLSAAGVPGLLELSPKLVQTAGGLAVFLAALWRLARVPWGVAAMPDVMGGAVGFVAALAGAFDVVVPAAADLLLGLGGGTAALAGSIRGGFIPLGGRDATR